jgi:hypothetical protein
MQYTPLECNMGIGPSVYYLYARDAKLNVYKTAPVYELLYNAKHMDDNRALGCFKHEVFALALTEDFVDCKAVYMYKDSWRLAKVQFKEGDENTCIVQFRSAAIKDQWDTCEERLAPRRWPLLERKFDEKWDQKESLSTSVSYCARCI